MKTDSKEKYRNAEFTHEPQGFCRVDEVENEGPHNEAGKDVADDEGLLQEAHRDRHECRDCNENTEFNKDTHGAT